MKKFDNPIPYMKHQVTEDDKNFVMEVLDGDFLTQGPFVSKVEEYMSNLTNKKYKLAAHLIEVAYYADKRNEKLHEAEIKNRTATMMFRFLEMFFVLGFTTS